MHTWDAEIIDENTQRKRSIAVEVLEVDGHTMTKEDQQEKLKGEEARDEEVRKIEIPHLRPR